MELEEVVPEPEELVPCANCGRTFALSSVERHFRICVRTHQTIHHRGKFDSSRQRIQGTELEQYLPPPLLKSPSRPRSRSVPSNGRSRGSITHEQCEYCGRSFGEKAIDRHREWCKSQAALRPQQPRRSSSPAYERLQARTKYRAPLAKSLRARTREKYLPNSTSTEKISVHKRASLPNTNSKGLVSAVQKQEPALTRCKGEYDVYQSAERQLRELGLLEDSPVLVRRGSAPEPRTRSESLSKSSGQNATTRSSRSQMRHQDTVPRTNEKSSTTVPRHQETTNSLNRKESKSSANSLIRQESLKHRESEPNMTFTRLEPTSKVSLTSLYCQDPVAGSSSNSINRQEPQSTPSPQLHPESLPRSTPSPQTQPESLARSTPSPLACLESLPRSTPSPQTHAESIPSSNQSPRALSSLSLNSSTELLIIEDEEDYLIRQLAHEALLSRQMVPKYLDLNVNGRIPEESEPSEANSIDGEKAEAERFFNTLKEKLENPGLSKKDCPLTQSLQYLDAALSLFHLDDLAVRASDAPRTRASTKRRLYSEASPLSLLSPDPAMVATNNIEDRCGGCGSPFPVPSARFCCLCGAKREII